MTIATIFRRLAAAFLLALSLPGALAAADGPAPEAAEPPLRVVILEQLLEPPPAGLASLSNAVRQLEVEFRPRSNEIEALVTQLETAQAAVQQAEQVAQKNQAAIDRAEQLARDIDQKSEDAGAAYARRQDEIFSPLIEQTDQTIQRYAESAGKGDVFLFTREDFNSIPAGQVVDVTAGFVGWANTQP